MKFSHKNLVLTSAIIFASLLCLQYSSSPPIDRTNRTGSNCTGCHSGTLNSGSGSISVSGITSYYPGGSYSFNLDVTGSSMHGFQVTSARASSSTSAAGTFTGTGYNVASQGGFSYARHSSTSTSGSWNVSWTAPSSAVGSVTFYAAGVAANGNGGTSGDNVYATTQTITQLPLITYTVNKADPSCFGQSDGRAFVTGASGGAGGSYSITWPSSISTSGDTAINLTAGTYAVTVTDGGGNEEVKSVTLNQGPRPSISNSTRSSVCGLETGQIQLRVSGSAAPFTYSWQGRTDTVALLDSIAAGSYAVTVTDAQGCTNSSNITVSQSGTIMELYVDTGIEYCGNSNAYLQLDSVIGNFGQIDILWSTTDTTTLISGLSSSNSYSLRVTDSAGCVKTMNYSPKAQNNVITATTSSSPDFCASGIGSSSIGNVTGGLGSYSYLWSTGDTLALLDSLFAIPLSVTITDSVGCSEVFRDTVESTGTPVLNMVDYLLNCYGDSSGILVVEAINGVEPYSYQWNTPQGQGDSAQLLSAGQYQVTVTDSVGCFDTITAIVSQPDSISLDSFNVINSRPDICQGSVVPFVSGGVSSYSYLWNDLTQTTTDTINNLCPGNYMLQVTDANSCVNSFNFEIEELPIPQGVDDVYFADWTVLKYGNSVHINPNTDSSYSYELYLFNGQLLKSGESQSGPVQVTNLPENSAVLLLLKKDSHFTVKKLF